MASNADHSHNQGTPISSQNLIFSGDDPELQCNRRKSFERFQSIVECLAKMDDDNQVSLVWKDQQQVNHQDSVIPINSLLFHYADTSTPIVVVVPTSGRVDERKLEQHLSAKEDQRRIQCSLVPADQVEEVCGFPPLSVPPIGHHVPLRIIVEASLYQPQNNILLGGGGHPQVQCLISAETLLRIEGTELASLIKTTASSLSSGESEEESLTAASPMQQKLSRPKILPYFQVAPPTLEQVQQALSDDHPNPLQVRPLTLVGRINGIRRMARRLVFVDIAPPDYVGTGTKADSHELPWKNPLDDQPMSVQLIAGKTFCQLRGGEPDGPEALKQFKVGQLIWVEGKTNWGNRDSLQHWVDKRSLDIVVWDYRVLEQRAPSRNQGISSPLPQKEQPPQERRPRTTTSSNDNVLQLTDVLTEAATIKVVDDLEGIVEFQQTLEMLVAEINGDKTPLLTPELTGIDCEWKPNFLLAEPGEPQPVLLLQISLQKLNQVYLLDLQTLLGPCQKDPASYTSLNQLETATSEALSLLLGSSQFVKIGFQLSHDLQRLAQSYPHIPAFLHVDAVVEVGTVAKAALQLARFPQIAKQVTSSLSRLTRHFLGLLDKEQQTSDWSCRPLTSAQQYYAALDAAVAPVLLEKSMALVNAKWLVESTQRMGRYPDDRSFARAVSSIRFHLLESNNPAKMRRLKAKKVYGSNNNHWLVTQSWITGGEVPNPPSVPTNGEELCVDVTGTPRTPTMTLKLRNNNNNNPVQDMIGQRLGKSKEACLEALLSGHEDFPPNDDAKLEFNPRSGYVEFIDLVALFVNTPVKPGEPSRGRYPNVWLEEGKYITWYLRKKEWMGGTSDLALKLLTNNQFLPPTVLFVKTKRGQFLCCGQCRVHPSTKEEPGGNNNNESTNKTKNKDWGGLVELQLELVDWPTLQHISHFQSMAFTTPTSLMSSNDEGGSQDLLSEAMPSREDLARAVLQGDLDKARSLALQLLPQEARSSRRS